MSKAIAVLERIAEIQVGITVPGLGIPYVLQAEPYQPSNMSSVSCPFFVNELTLSPNTANLPIAAGQQFRELNIMMMLCVARKQANIDLKYGVQETLQWSDAVFAAFAQHVRLSSPSKLIKSSTNASPIVVTTTVRHHFTSGDAVTISGHLVNTNANGPWIVTVIDDHSFSIPGVGNGTGGQTGECRLTQPDDMTDHVVDAVITQWSPAVPYEYGDAEFLAIPHNLKVREMYVTTISG